MDRRTSLELKFKLKRHMGRPRKRWFCLVLESIKKGEKSWQGSGMKCCGKGEDIATGSSLGPHKAEVDKEQKQTRLQRQL
jgi:hypothetical protein